VVVQPVPRARLRRTEEEDGDASSDRDLPEVRITGHHGQRWLPRQCHLAQVDVAGVAKAEIPCTLHQMAAALEEEDDGLGDVVVRQEPYPAARARWRDVA
jgi:hypothetical protein